MRSTIVASALLTLVAAAPAPIPQDIDFDLALALPNPTYTIATDATAQTVEYTASAIFASALDQITSTTLAIGTDNATTSATLAKRTACAPEAAGATGAPTYTPDTPSAFLANPLFSSTASAAPTPSGYSQTFENLNASNSAYGYLGFTTLQTYNVSTCAAKCNAINGCMAINIYFERDPSVDPGTGDSGCANPASVTRIKCVFWGGPVNAGNALNTGQYQNEFEVVIAGSNGYVNDTLVSPSGYGGANYLGNAAINAPLDSYGYNSYMGAAIFNSGPFNVSLCADACTTKSAYAMANPPTDGSPVQTCQFFNTYILYINNTKDLQGQYCAMYSESWGSSYATNTGQYQGYDDFLIEYSYSFSNSTSPGTANKVGAVYQAAEVISYSSLQPYCSTLLGYSVPVTTVQATTTGSTLTVTTTATDSYTSTVSVSVSAALQKRDYVTTIPVAAIMKVADNATSSMTAVTITYTDLENKKRALSTPAGLTQYPGAVITSACSLEVSSASTTSTITNEITVTDTVTQTSTFSTAVATVTSFCGSTCPLNLTNFEITTTGTGNSEVDCQSLNGPGLNDYFVGWLPYLVAEGKGFPIKFTFINSTGYLVTTDSTGASYDLAFSGNSAGYPVWTTSYTGQDSNNPLVCSIAANGRLSCTVTVGSDVYSQFVLYQPVEAPYKTYLGVRSEYITWGTNITLYAYTSGC